MGAAHKAPFTAPAAAAAERARPRARRALTSWSARCRYAGAELREPRRERSAALPKGGAAPPSAPGHSGAGGAGVRGGRDMAAT